MAGSSRFLGPALLLVTTLFWGGGFVAQKLGAGHLGPVGIIVTRSALAGAFLGLVHLFLPRRAGLKAQPPYNARTVLRGVLCGVALFVPMYAQQKAFDYPIPAGVCAFLTTNYILVVPLLGLAFGRRASWAEWLAIPVALAGTYLICMKPGESFGLGLGEAWTLACAVLFAVQVLTVDRLAPGTDTVALSVVMFLACAACGVPLLFFGREAALFTLPNVAAAAWAIVYLGLGSSGVGYTLQNIAQGLRTPPALAAIIMSLESVFGALFGWLFFGELLSLRAACGCALVLGASLFAVLGARK